MSADNSRSNSPAKSSGAVGSLKSRIAAFESGAASNASKSAAASKDILHANLNGLRQKFDREGDKPLEVKGSFGLGAAPPREGKPDKGERAVSLGIGRAASPMHAPSVAVPSQRIPSTNPSPIRPTSLRSDSSTSTSTSGITTNSSLLGPRLAHLNIPKTPVDDPSGLRTPMSSISLSSMAVESGSVAGDGGSTTAEEDDDNKSQPGTPVKEAQDVFSPLTEVADEEITSAAVLEKKEREGEVEHTQGEEIHVASDAAEKAQEELEKYEKEAPAESTQTIQPSPSIPQLDIQDTSNTDASSPSSPHKERDGSNASPLSSPSKRPGSVRSRPSSSTFPNLKRSSTAHSLAESQPESDVADTKLEEFDSIPEAPLVSSPLPAIPQEAEPKASESGSPSKPEGDNVAANEAVSVPAPHSEKAPDNVPSDENSMDLDDHGLPKVKCSDCQVAVSVVELGEHVCDPQLSPRNHRQSDTPIKEPAPDVPSSDFTGSPSPSPKITNRSLPSRPDVPVDEFERESVTSEIAKGDSAASPRWEGDDAEEDYMTARTSHRDSMDVLSQKPNMVTPSSSERELASKSVPSDVGEEDTEELASFVGETHASDTPRQSGFAPGTGIPQPDSPTPDKVVLSPISPTMPKTPATARPITTVNSDGDSGKMRRSSSKSKYPGDTDSESEVEPGTVSIIN